MKFSNVAVKEGCEFYDKLVEREEELYKKGDIRSPFARDYTRILHCLAYRRLKHKTQVFYNVGSDHICTRMEHVSHVESVSYTIAKYLGLNDELTKAIACGHDLGHAPFGHCGEEILNELYDKFLDQTFWHERNGLYMIDSVELLSDDNGTYKNLDLTYAVRDGIVAHCGEIDNNRLMPRTEFIDLENFKKGMNPITFEGCVVKISDKIAYVGRDIEDAFTLGFLTEQNIKELGKIVDLKGGNAVNTSNIISNLIIDICENSSPENGICLSDKMSETLNKIKDYNSKYIYKNDRLTVFTRYAKLVINELFYTLYGAYNKGDVFGGLKAIENRYNTFVKEFIDYLSKYTDKIDNYQNRKIYEKLSDEKVYVRAILDYLSGMTDRYAVEMFNELISY